ncbi:hypothetical protein TRFO_39318 [Tritrichomonas foetus]|uniref:Uncharacterized protein n=1 Tax=Tritrichomonas foetus TaxID=1144522 RepID=A0A1J4J5K2_9EUKA|nr:hypothetical protein TRFO_39318 [Tritrichomonas foetus]|eukprot:OHS94526.1 hypothetical protein TRFO_39318 [Tritrichomonas foetus]
MISYNLFQIYQTQPEGFKRDSTPSYIAGGIAISSSFTAFLDFIIERVQKTKIPYKQPSLKNFAILAATHAIEETSCTISVEIIKTLYKDFQKELDSPKNAWKAYAVSLAGGATIYTLAIYPVNYFTYVSYPEVKKEDDGTFKSVAKAWTINASFGAVFGGTMGYLTPKIKQMMPKDSMPSLKVSLYSIGSIAAATCAANVATLPIRQIFYGKPWKELLNTSLKTPVISQF